MSSSPKYVEPIKRYQIGYGTSAFGEVKSDSNIRPLYMLPRQMELEAYYRGISEPNSYEKILREWPSFEWQKQMLYWFTTLSWDEKMIVNSYGSYGHMQMNERLRLYPESKAILNDVIARAPPLPHDIVVYRYMTGNYPLISNGVYKHTGYLSTSFYASFVVFKDCEKNMRYLRIVVPKGFRCIYIPSLEFELLFPHNTEIEVLGIRDIDVLCENGIDKITSSLYEAIMVSEPF